MASKKPATQPVTTQTAAAVVSHSAAVTLLPEPQSSLHEAQAFTRPGGLVAQTASQHNPPLQSLSSTQSGQSSLPGVPHAPHELSHVPKQQAHPA